MNSLEFINEQIEIFNRRIEFLNSELNNKHTGIDDPLELDLTTEEIQTALSQTTQVLQTLNQIKDELEAWEVVKKRFEYFEMVEGDVFTHKVEGYYQTQQFDNKDLGIIKKALEIKDE
jgi:cell wall assembly regulator SMI1